MKRFRKRSALLTMSMLLLLLVSACAPGASGNVAADVLSKSAEAMRQLKTAHFDLDMSLKTNLGGLVGLSDEQNPQEESDLTISAHATGKMKAPDQVAMDVTFDTPLSKNTQETQFSQIISDNKVYHKASNGQWYVRDIQQEGGLQDIFSGFQVNNYDRLLELSEDAKLTDHGVQDREGQKLRHITVEYSKEVLNELLSTIGVADEGSEHQAYLQMFLGMLKLDKAILDVWVNETTWYTHHMDLQLGASMNLGGIGTAVADQGKGGSMLDALPSNLMFELNLGTDFSKFNEEVTIEVPENALPAPDVKLEDEQEPETEFSW